MTLHAVHRKPRTIRHAGAAAEFLLAHAVSNPSEPAVMAAVRGRTDVLSELMAKGLEVNLEMLLCAIHWTEPSPDPFEERAERRARGFERL